MGLSTELRRRPAMEALYWADRARARGRNSSSAFYRPRGRGRASLGWANWGLAARGGAARGDRRPAVTGLRRRVSSSGVASRERCHANQGRGSGFGRRRDAWGGQVASPAYGAVVGEVQGDGG